MEPTNSTDSTAPASQPGLRPWAYAKQPKPARKPPRILKRGFYFGFAVTFAFITMMVYGFVLMLKDSVDRGERAHSTFSARHQENQTLPLEDQQAYRTDRGQPTQAEQQIRERNRLEQGYQPQLQPQQASQIPYNGGLAPEVRQTRGYELNANPNLDTESLTVEQIISGTLAGDEYAAAHFWLITGLIGCFFFGGLTVALYLISSKDDYELGPPPPPRRKRIDTRLLGRRI